ncbi:MAG: SemiSWEET transporter [Candidatus Thermoplasmatota archaeon]|nr:SemiSWEET transporter [Candidatus Thermoplasmatota archaeon]
MNFDLFTVLGFAAGAVTSVGFIPQLIRGYRTKKLDDISYWMPLVLLCGMSLWLLYGILREDIAIIIANSFGVSCNVLLLLMKKWYS